MIPNTTQVSASWEECIAAVSWSRRCPKDRKAIKLAAENYPDSKYYVTKDVLTQLGIGEAFISVLNEKGIPTPLARTMLRAPMSRMDVLSPKEIKQVLDNSRLIPKYNDEVDRESAYEMLKGKIDKINKEKTEEAERKEKEKTRKKSASTSRRSTRQNPIIKVLTSATFIRSVFGILKKVLK